MLNKTHNKTTYQQNKIENVLYFEQGSKNRHIILKAWSEWCARHYRKLDQVASVVMIMMPEKEKLRNIKEFTEYQMNSYLKSTEICEISK